MLRTTAIVTLLLLSACGSGATVSTYQDHDTAQRISEGPMVYPVNSENWWGEFVADFPVQSTASTSTH